MYQQKISRLCLSILSKIDEGYNISVKIRGGSFICELENMQYIDSGGGLLSLQFEESSVDFDIDSITHIDTYDFTIKFLDCVLEIIV